jgi:hypothetical protein
MLKIYFKCVLLSFYLIFSFGWLLPFLMSSDTDELPLVGLAYLAISPVIVFCTIKSIINNLKKSKNEEV